MKAGECNTDEVPVVDDLGFWACVLDVPESQLEFAVRMVGRDANAVARYVAMLVRLSIHCH